MISYSCNLKKKSVKNADVFVLSYMYYNFLLNLLIMSEEKKSHRESKILRRSCLIKKKWTDLWRYLGKWYKTNTAKRVIFINTCFLPNSEEKKNDIPVEWLRSYSLIHHCENIKLLIKIHVKRMVLNLHFLMCKLFLDLLYHIHCKYIYM